MASRFLSEANATATCGLPVTLAAGDSHELRAFREQIKTTVAGVQRKKPRFFDLVTEKQVYDGGLDSIPHRHSDLFI